jgi:hypothetical protein
MLVDTTVWVDHLRRGDAVFVGPLVSADAAGEKLLTRDRRLTVAAESLGLA